MAEVSGAVGYITLSTQNAYVTATETNFTYLFPLARVTDNFFWNNISTTSNIAVYDASTGLQRSKCVLYLSVAGKAGILYFDAALGQNKSYRIYFGKSVSVACTTNAFSNGGVTNIFPMSESGGSSVSDGAGGLSGALAGTSVSLGSAGKIYRSASFTGTTSRISVNDKVVADGNITMSVILNPTTALNGPAYYLASHKTLYLYASSTYNSGCYRILNSSPGATVNSATASYQQQYTNLTVTRKSDGKTTFYLNGVISGALDQAASAGGISDTNLMIGNYFGGTTFAFNGTMENFMFISGIKSSQWISDLSAMTMTPELFYGTSYPIKKLLGKNIFPISIHLGI